MATSEKALHLILTALVCSVGPACSEDRPVSLYSLTPENGEARSGVEVVIEGRGFIEGAFVLFGDREAASVEVLSSGEIAALTPVLVAGTYDVTVRNPDGTGDTLVDGYEALALDLRFSEVPSHYFPDLSGLPVTDAAVGDFDGDGDADILLALSGEESRILDNNGFGKFEDTSLPDSDVENPLPPWNADTRAVAVADFDQDGDLDIFACNGSDEPDLLLAGDGRGAFEDASDAALPSEALTCTLAVAGLVTDDARPDLVVVVQDAAGEGPAEIRLLENMGKARPSDETVEFEYGDAAAVDVTGETLSSIALADADGDGLLDMIVSSTSSESGAFLRLYLGRVSSTPDSGSGFEFVEAGRGMLTPPVDPVAHVLVLDADRNGAPDLMAASSTGQDRLFVNDGAGHFFDAYFTAMPVDRASGRCAAAADMNLDGLVDIVTANFEGQNRLYVNRGDGSFADVTPALPIVSDKTARLLLLDAEMDGDMDVAFLNVGGDRSKLYISVE
jgi:hypothetical protein